MKHIRRTCLTLAGTTFLAVPFAPLFAQDSPGPAPGVQDPPANAPPGNAAQPIFDFGTGDEAQDEGMDFGDLTMPEENGAIQTPAAPPTEGGATELVAFNSADISQVLLYLQRLAQRPVQPDSLVLSQQARITIINSTPLTRTQAMNLVVEALFANRIAVIDRGSHLAIVPVANIQEGLVPVYGPEVELRGREDRGMVVEKVFQIKYGKASTIKDKIQAQGPPNMKIEVEDASNQIIALFNIGTLQRLEEQIAKLDISGTNLQLETFNLLYADADNVAKQIVGVFGQQDETQQGGRNSPNVFGPQRRNSDQGLTTSTQLSVVTDKSRNSVTVRAERDIIEQVRKQIKESWDVKIDDNIALPLVIELKNSDAVKMAEMLNKIFAQEGEAVQVTQGDFFFGGGGNAGRAQQTTSQNAQGEGPKLAPLGGQVSFTADNTKNTLIVTTRSHEYDSMIRDFIASLDVPGDVNAPVTYELRYADAEDLANRLNALLAEAGSRVDVERTSQELTQRSNVAQVSQQQSGQQQPQQQQAQAMQFPWQSGSPDPNARKASNLIGQVRIMPIPRMNGLLVVSPPELRQGMADLINTLDAPGRQVLIQAIIAEVSVDDATSLGIRWGSGNVSDGPNQDNRIVVGSTIDGTKNQLINALFDTSTLGVNVDLNVALQALAQVTNVSVLSRPGIVTSDNEEASFFDGQDIPFITDSSTSDVGGITQSFDYLAVGIQLSVRPHITVEGNVDLRVNLQLSSVVPGQTLFGGSILDRRETTTKVTISDGQTVVISGIRRTVLNDIVRKVPLLGDIPLIGGLFRSTEKSESRTELVAFIRPIILDSPERIRGTSLDEFKLLNKSRKELEGADIEKNPAGVEHWNEPMFRDKQNEETKPSSDGGVSLPWMQSPAGGSTTGARPLGTGTVSLAGSGTSLASPQNSKKD